MGTHNTALRSMLVLALLGSVVSPLVASCGPMNTTSDHDVLPSQTVRQGFTLVSRCGVQVACPKDWRSETDPDPRLVFQVSQDENTMITVAVLDALPLSYYEGLVSQGSVTRTTVAGQLAYVNESTYPDGNRHLTSICVSIIEGDKACHIMFLCNASARDALTPVLDEVSNSVIFTGRH